MTLSWIVPKRYLIASPVLVTVAGVTGVVSGGVTGVTGVTGVVVPLPELEGLVGFGLGVVVPGFLDGVDGAGVVAEGAVLGAGFVEGELVSVPPAVGAETAGAGSPSLKETARTPTPIRPVASFVEILTRQTPLRVFGARLRQLGEAISPLGGSKRLVRR